MSLTGSQSVSVPALRYKFKSGRSLRQEEPSGTLDVQRVSLCRVVLLKDNHGDMTQSDSKSEIRVGQYGHGRVPLILRGKCKGL